MELDSAEWVPWAEDVLWGDDSYTAWGIKTRDGSVSLQGWFPGVIVKESDKPEVRISSIKLYFLVKRTYKELRRSNNQKRTKETLQALRDHLISP